MSTPLVPSFVPITRQIFSFAPPHTDAISDHEKKSNIRGDVPKDSGHPPPTDFSQVTLLFAEALKLHQAGRLADAENIYNQILAMQPDHLTACMLRGVIFISAGIIQRQFVNSLALQNSFFCAVKWFAISVKSNGSLQPSETSARLTANCPTGCALVARCHADRGRRAQPSDGFPLLELLLQAAVRFRP